MRVALYVALVVFLPRLTLLQNAVLGVLVDVSVVFLPRLTLLQNRSKGVGSMFKLCSYPG